MGESCAVRTYVRNPKGEMVESKLFNDLLSYLPRSSAKEYYAVGTDRDFLDSVRNKAKFDENGEITFNSLRKLAKIDVKEEQVIDKLNKEIGAGTMTYDKAVLKIKEFNSKNSYNDDFMAVMTYNNGQYDVRIERNTPERHAELNKVAEKQEIINKLVSNLRAKGVDVTFLTEGKGGRYSVENAEKTAEGLYSLIQVAHGEDVDVTLAEEAGHFAVGALGKNPLVDRLMKLLDEKTQREILGDEYNSKNLSDNPRREVAGMLVGQALHDKLENRTPWQKIAHRISNIAKSVFARLSGNEVQVALIEARKTARDIASGFLSDNFQGNVETALTYRETLYSNTLPYNVRVFKNMVEVLGGLSKELKAVSSDKLASTIEAYIGQAVNGRDDILNHPGVDPSLIAFNGMCQALVDISDLIGPNREIDNLIESVDFSNPADFYSRMAEHGNSLRQARVFIRNAMLIASILQEAVDANDNKLVIPAGLTLNNVMFKDVVGNMVTIDFRKMLSTLNTTLQIMNSRLLSKENAFFLRFCEDIYGSSYIDTSAQIVWKNKRIALQEAKRTDLSELLVHLEDDIDVFHRYLGSMSNNPDIIGQIADKSVKAVNKIADDQTIQYQDKLRQLQDEFEKKFGKDTSIIFEKDSEGNWTGNFITAPNDEIRDAFGQRIAVNYGEWEKARSEFRRQFEEDFKKRHPNWESMTGYTRGMMFSEEYDKAYKEWNKKNSTPIVEKDDMGFTIRTEWHPNAKYKSDQYDNLIKSYPGIETWLGEMMEIKKELDSRLSPGATHLWRVPQFKGTFSNRLANKRNLMSRGKAMKLSIRDSILETFCESSEDTDYGDNTTLNSPYDNLLGTPMDYEQEKVNRVPVFGINKLEDMSQLSTDIFHSMLSYASMANSYQALNSVVDALEIGREALNSRTVKGKSGKRERDLEKHTRAYTRYTKFLDKQVYGISATHWGFTIKTGYKRNEYGQYVDKDGNVIRRWGNKDFKNQAVPVYRKVLLNKMIQALTKWGTYRFLGGNVLGGAVNTGTGFIEEFKEAASSDEFDLKDLYWAHKYYWKSLPSNWTHATSLQKNDEISLWIRYFNVRGDNREKFRSRYNRKSFIRRACESGVYLPYSSGDHYMQSLSYLALAHKTRLYGVNGTRTNLFNAYERNEISRAKRKIGKLELGDKFDKVSYEMKFKGALFASSTGAQGITSKSLNEKEVFLKNLGDLGKYRMLENLLSQVERNISSPLLPVSLSTEQQDYLNANNLGLGDLYELQTKVQKDIFDIIWTADDETEYMDKAREINNRMHGIYNNQDKTAFHQQWYTNAFLAMKGYALGMMERRYSNAHHSIALGTDVEGSLNTMSKLWFSVFSKDVSTTFGNAVGATLLAPFALRKDSKLRQKLKNAGFSDFQISNMKRNWMDYFVMGLLYMMRMLCSEPPKDEREEDYVPDQTEGLCYYFMSRWLREQEAFNMPWGVMTESHSLLNLVPVGGAALWDLGKFGYEVGGAQIADEDNTNFFYGKNDPNGKYEKGEAKWKNHALGMVPYVKSWYNFNNPYEAWKSYEYGTKLSGR